MSVSVELFCSPDQCSSPLVLVDFFFLRKEVKILYSLQTEGIPGFAEWHKSFGGLLLFSASSQSL